MERKYLFRHNLQGITMTIMCTSLEGARAILQKIVVDSNHWENYN